MLKHVNIRLEVLSREGKRFKWTRPPPCKCGHIFWGHGYVARYFDGYSEKLWLKKWRCPLCRSLITFFPNGYIKFVGSETISPLALNSSIQKTVALTTLNSETVTDQLVEFLNNSYSRLTSDSFKSGQINTNAFFAEVKIGKIFFLEIAKLRAIRILWANLLVALDLSLDYDISIIASPDNEVLTDDQNSNMIAITTMTLSGVIGGANFMYSRQELNDKDEKSKTFIGRITRNIQHILQLESYMDQVGDPGSGSLYIEQITDSLVQQSWDKFKIRLS